MAHRAPRPEREKKHRFKKAVKDPTLSVPVGIILGCIIGALIFIYVVTHGG